MTRQDLEFYIKGNSESVVNALRQAQQELKATRDEMGNLRGSAKDGGDSFIESAAKAAVGFEAVKETLKETIGGYFEAEGAQLRLSAAIRNSGLPVGETIEQFKKLGEEAQRLSGIDKDAATSAFASAQARLGNIPITKELITATANLSAVTREDFASSLEKIVQSATSAKNALKKHQVVIDESLTASQKLATITEQLNAHYHDLGEASATGAVRFAILKNETEELGKKIGEILAPYALQAAESLTKMVEYLKDNPQIVKFGATLLAVAAAVTSVGVAVEAFAAISAVSAPVIGLLAGVVGAIGLPCLAVIAAVELLLNYWREAWAAIVADSSLAVGVITSVLGGLGDLITAIVNGDVKGMKAAVSDAMKGITEEISGYGEKYKSVLKDLGGAQREFAEETKKNLDNSKADQEAAQRRLADLKLREAQELESRRDHLEAMQLANEQGSRELIRIKSEESAVLKQLATSQSADEKAILRDKLDQLKAEEANERAQDKERRTALNEDVLSSNKYYLSLNEAARAEYRRKYLAGDAAQYQSDQDAQVVAAQKETKRKTDLHNKFLADELKYGTALATIRKAFASEEVQGADKAGKELVALQNSKNDTLRDIGKAAAIQQIGISTAHSAMNVFEGFSAIPIIGYALGVAAAAAVIAYGAEQISNVTAANEGGLIPGGGPNADSVHAFLTPGELVVPRDNFDEVVGAVRKDRQGGSDSEVVALLSAINSKFSSPTNIVVNGDILAEPTFVQRLAKAISDGIEFNNIRIKGVNA